MDGDAAVIACNEDDLQVGAAWYRFLGDRTAFLWYISSQIPELAIAVRPDERGLGIGHQLMNAILELAASQGIDQISLSV
jgi:GNAT superfamily N-acetyltransferase